jgi:hypothetical protein
MSAKILISAISVESNSNSRWKIEKRFWQNNLNKYKNVDFHLIQCSKNKSNGIEKRYDCEESLVPGIFQKTILNYAENIDKGYDFFVRTNTNTFPIIKHIVEYCNNRRNEQVFSGVYCVDASRSDPREKPVNFVGGWGIVLDKNTAKVLVTEGKKPENFDKKGIPDDVLIAMILETKNIRCTTVDEANIGMGGSHIWDCAKTFDENIEMINSKKSLFVRFQNRDPEWQPKFDSFRVKMDQLY